MPEDDMDDLIGTAEVARLSGVGPTAVKRWADEGLLPSTRTAGGHRRFARSEVERFLRADARGAAYGLADAVLAAQDGHEIEARLLAERARRGAWFRVAEAVGEALAEMGRRWEAGAISIGEEHLASERLARALVHVAESLPADPGAPRCLLACAEGDDHTLGLLLIELCLREAGWATLWAGRRTPTAEIAGLVRGSGARLVALSASCASTDALDLRRQAETVARACRPAGAQLALGGAGAWPDHPRGARRFRSLEAFSTWARELAAAGPGAA
jgi:excisionase family DNA binding protein